MKKCTFRRDPSAFECEVSWLLGRIAFRRDPSAFECKADRTLSRVAFERDSNAILHTWRWSSSRPSAHLPAHSKLILAHLKVISEVASEVVSAPSWPACRSRPCAFERDVIWALSRFAFKCDYARSWVESQWSIFWLAGGLTGGILQFCLLLVILAVLWRFFRLMCRFWYFWWFCWIWLYCSQFYQNSDLEPLAPHWAPEMSQGISYFVQQGARDQNQLTTIFVITVLLMKSQL